MSDTGRLQISVFSRNVAHPQEGAVVRVYSRDNRQVEEQTTDASGQTHVIHLPAPPADYTQESGQPKPYGEYAVAVTTKDSGASIVEGVQVYAETTALQNVLLNGNERIIIPKPVLFGEYPAKLPEEDVKPLPESKGFVVLPDPVVPQYVVVHAGLPGDSAAPNYWVGFKDYIKNVASCEIYSTWPEATIRANVLAIISFTLNRVFTEWYRGKGYSFTITNSTAYDHAFSYGRTIYKEISDAVDDMFTTFVTRQGIRQPLLTQYCDGKSVRCPGWMTQWGSRDLGARGHSAVDILKSFYGQGIFLMQAKKVDGVPKSFSGANLQTGSRGGDVRTIQEQLNKISGNYPAIPRVKVDGVFGPTTRKSVEIFQSTFGRPVSGIVDFGTWYRISDIFVAVTRMAELR